LAVEFSQKYCSNFATFVLTVRPNAMFEIVHPDY